MGQAGDDKRRLREVLGARRRAVAPAAAQRAARAVAEHVLGSPEFQAADQVGLYVALSDELPTRPLLEATWARGKRVLLPRMAPGRRLEFATASGFGDLRAGPHGVLQPAPEIPAERLEPGALVLVPGVAFDPNGHRLGRGGGFYDRTFPPAAETPATLFGLAYALQIVDSVPHGPRDRAVDAVVTEEGIRRVSRTAQCE